jgi:hypothetical protein
MNTIKSLVLCAVFGLGTFAGSIGGCAAAGRYELTHVQNDLFRIDKLTGKSWFWDGDWTEIKEQSR